MKNMNTYTKTEDLVRMKNSVKVNDFKNFLEVTVTLLR